MGLVEDLKSIRREASLSADEVAVIDRAIETLQEAARTLLKQEEHLQYFRDSPNLAFYTQGLKAQAALAAVHAVVEQWSPMGEDVPADELRKALETDV